MDDEAGYHTFKIAIKWRQGLRILCIDWPAQSSDLHPIENLWRIIKMRISAHLSKKFGVSQNFRGV